jgi:hypothetical protein
MSDADKVTQRYLALWTQYLTALLADPQAMETLSRWASFTEQFAHPDPGAAKQGSGAAPFPAWPPFFGPFGFGPFELWPAPREGGNGSAAEPAGLSALARRVDELERRVAKLERRPAARSSRRSPGTKAR